MQFIPMTAGKGARLMSLELRQELADGKRVLWLFSGGSNIPLTVQIMAELPAELTSKLTLMPIDERYGPVGHIDSNVQQLLDENLNLKQATLFAPLDGSNIEKTEKRYNDAAQAAFNAADIVIAQIGMGEDGHIAGILPHSPALDASGFVTSYNGPDYKRLTLTLPAIRQIDRAFLFAYGRPKRAALDRLCDGDIKTADQPAQVLRELRDVTVYNDQLEERNA